MYLCRSIIGLCFIFLVQINCVTLFQRTGLIWTITPPKNDNLESLIHELRNLRFNKSNGSQIQVKNSNSEKLRGESLRKFYLEQQNLFLKELVVPCLKSLKSGLKAHKPVEGSQHTKKGSRVWEYRVSDESNKLKCSVLSQVPPGTVLIRPNKSKCDFISVPVLNNLVRNRNNIIKILYPKHNINDLNEIFRYASFKTMLISGFCSNDKLRKSIVALSIIYGINLSRDVILDLFFYIINSKLFWNTTIHSYWSKTFSVPIPLLVLSLSSLLNSLMGLVTTVDNKLKDTLISIEGEMINSDLRKRFIVRRVKDKDGNLSVHTNYFDM